MSSSSSDGKFACSACGKQYRWKPELAGRSAKCACGAKLVVPATAPVVPIVAAANKCPSCKSALADGAVICVNCGLNLKTGKTLAAVVVETDDEDDAKDPA